MSDWKEYKLGEISDVRDGTHDSPKQKDCGKPLVTSKHIKGGKIDLSSAYLISMDDFEKINKRSKVDKWDVLFSMIGTIGEMVIVDDEPDFAIKNVGLFKTHNEKLSKWIYYYLKSPKAQKELKASLKGSTQQYISLKDLRNFPINLPSENERNFIIAILSSLDDKIELNNRINRNLEDLAQALFKHWFVDFDFPDENGEPYRSSGGEMVESELKEIPKGWDIETFKDQIEATRGLSYKGNGLTDSSNGIPMINLKSVYEGGGYQYEGIKYYSGEYKDRHKMEPWDLAVTNTEQGHKYLLIGYPAIIPKTIGTEAIFSHHIYKVKALETSYLTNQFLYYLIKYPTIREQIIGACNGTTVNMLKIHGLETPKFVLPEKKIIGLFSKLIKDIWEKIEINHQENESLKHLRDTLLPKLISDKLEINESIFAEAT